MSIRRKGFLASRSIGPTSCSVRLGLRRAMQHGYGFDHLPTEDEMVEGAGLLQLGQCGPLSLLEPNRAPDDAMPPGC
jgi:hypothetical protein